MKRGSNSNNPTKQGRTPHRDPLRRAVESAEKDFWTLRPPEDIRRMVARAIKESGRDKLFWVSECVRAGLSKYAGKKDEPSRLIGKGAA